MSASFTYRAGSRYFCESFYEHPCPTSGKNYATAHACGCPSRPGHSFATQQGVAHLLSNDSTRCRKACIFTTLKLRENTCPIASGDYSRPVSQRLNIAPQGFSKDSGEPILMLTPRNCGASPVVYYSQNANVSTTDPVVDDLDSFTTNSATLYFLAVDSEGKHEIGEPKRWIADLIIRHQL
ncbi:MAG: hypothetical protein ACXWTE_06995, partial [Methylobacter sp.]